VGKPPGPASDAEFARLAQTGVIGPQALVWHSGMPDWLAQGTLTGALVFRLMSWTRILTELIRGMLIRGVVWIPRELRRLDEPWSIWSLNDSSARGLSPFVGAGHRALFCNAAKWACTAYRLDDGGLGRAKPGSFGTGAKPCGPAFSYCQ